MDAGGYLFISTRMHGRSSGKALFKEADWPHPVSQSLALELITTLDLAETSVLDYAWHVIPYSGKYHLVLIAYLSIAKESGSSHLGLAVIANIKLQLFAKSGDYALAS